MHDARARACTGTAASAVRGLTDRRPSAYDQSVTVGRRLIGVSGLVGAGKSTLVPALAAELGFAAVPERASPNPYLPRLYADPNTWAFRNLLFFFERSLIDPASGTRSTRGIVQERLPDEHLEVFAAEYRARGYLSAEDLALLQRLRALMAPRCPPPNLLIHIDVDAETAFARVRQRGRDYERSISLDYLEALAARYENFIGAWGRSPVLRLNSLDADLRDIETVRDVAHTVARLVGLPDCRTASTSDGRDRLLGACPSPRTAHDEPSRCEAP